jgi:hypothetical protein
MMNQKKNNKVKTFVEKGSKAHLDYIRDTGLCSVIFLVVNYF